MLEIQRATANLVKRGKGERTADKGFWRVMFVPMKWRYLLIIILCMGAAFCMFYSSIENFFLFFPQKSFDLTPEDLHLGHQEIFFDTEDGKRLHGWFFPLEAASPVILFFHGNAGNISHRLDNIRLLLERKLQVFIFDYRGYGKSSGRPSEKGIYTDGLAAHECLTVRLQIPPDQIILFGRSLGSAVAIEVASKRPVRSMIIESAFTSTKEMARTLFLFGLLSPFLPAHYNNQEKITRVNVPKLLIHGEDDEIVPFSMGHRLFDASKAPKYFFPLKGAGHNDTYVVGGERYFQTLVNFARDSRI